MHENVYRPELGTAWIFVTISEKVPIQGTTDHLLHRLGPKLRQVFSVKAVPGAFPVWHPFLDLTFLILQGNNLIKL